LLRFFKKNAQFQYAYYLLDEQARAAANGHFDADDLADALRRLTAAGFIHKDHVLGHYCRDDDACDGLDHG
jgi:hypothetical protein